MASLALVSKYGIPPLAWQKVIARFDVILCMVLAPQSVDYGRVTYHSLVLLHVNLVSENNLSFLAKISQ
jgi:hypothetical protein